MITIVKQNIFLPSNDILFMVYYTIRLCGIDIYTYTYLIQQFCSIVIRLYYKTDCVKLGIVIWLLLLVFVSIKFYDETKKNYAFEFCVKLFRK